MRTKTCIKCSEPKSVSCFNNYEPERPRNICKTCVREANRILEKKNKLENAYKDIPHFIKKCFKCSEEKDSHQFHKDRSKKFGITSTCKACATKNTAAHYYRNKTDLNRSRTVYTLRKVYGITPEQWNACFEEQGRRCATCKTAEPGNKRGTWATDHDHKTGKFRGILCTGCNLALGAAKDSTETLVSLIEYLRKHQPAPLFEVA